MRSADAHLTPQELQDLLFAAAEPNVTTADREKEREAQQHLDGCDVCKGMAREYANADSLLRALGPRKESLQQSNVSRRRSDCPPDETWLRLAAGLIDDTAASPYVSHAAGCDCCGLLLKEAMQDLAEDMSPEEVGIESLPIAGAEWQREMGKKIAAAARTYPNAAAESAIGLAPKKGSKDSDGVGKIRFTWWPRFAFAAAGLAIAVAGFLLWQKLNPDPNKLVAEAYAEHRTVELRMAGVPYGPLRIERGADRAHQNVSPSLLQAEAILASQGSKHSEDPKWLQAQARAALLEGNYQDAIRKIEDALLRHPDDPTLLIDRATALYERAGNLGPPAASDYGEAVEDLGRALNKVPDDPAALFNRAIVYEKLSMPTQSIADCDRYLSLYPDGPWADEVRERKKRLEALVKAHDQALAEPLAQPSQFIVQTRDSAGLARIDERIEDYQDLAVREWLPTGFGAGQGGNDERAALDVLGTLLVQRHSDPWLNDLLAKVDHTPYSVSAVKALSDLVRASAAGNAEGAYERAKSTEELFRKAKNTAGLRRAEMEEVHALQRSQRHDLCLVRAASALAAVHQIRYVWIDAQLDVDRAACALTLARFAEGRPYISLAEEKATGGHFPFLGLRAIGIASLADYFEGDEAAAWTKNEQGLSEFWQQDAAPPVRAHQFYDALSHAAEESGYMNLAVALAQESARTVALSGNRRVEILARERLVDLAVQAGQLEVARAELKKAADLSSQQTVFQATDRLYSETVLAEIDLRQGLISGAEARLKSIKAVLPSMTALAPALRYRKVSAELYRLQGKLNEAENELLEAVATIEHSQAHVKTAAEQESWKRENADIYRELVSLQIARGENAKALDTWESYLSGGLSASSGEPRAFFESGTYRSQFTSPDRTLLSYALLPEGLAIWVADSRGLSLQLQHVDPNNLRKQAARFSGLCADYGSNIEVLKSQAARLFDIFVRPVSEQLSSARPLVVELDESLSDLPLQALVSPDGSYLAKRFVIVSSPGAFYERALRNPSPIVHQMRSLVAASSANVTSDGTRLQGDPDAMSEANDVRSEFVGAKVLGPDEVTVSSIEENVAQAELFHFVGHALSSPSGEGLLVPVSHYEATLWGGRNLPPQFFKNLRLAFLSACSTGKTLQSRRESHGGTVRAMLAAGVPNVVASRWDVDSAVTRRLVRLFYAAALEGMSVPAALREAELKIMENPGTAHPYYWAAFGAFGHI